MVKTEKNKAWESGIEILESIYVNIPISLLYICNIIADKVKGNEFSILTTIEKKEDNEVWISENYYIPQQEVAVSTVDYLPDDEAHSYNVVIHRHPDNLNNFSSTDRDYINQNFELSLLYTKRDGFVNGVYNLKHGRFLVPIEVCPMVEYPVMDVDTSKIKEKVYVQSYHSHSYSDSNWPQTNVLLKNKDEKKEEDKNAEERGEWDKMLEIEELQREIDNLEWELDKMANFSVDFSMVDYYDKADRKVRLEERLELLTSFEENVEVVDKDGKVITKGTFDSTDTIDSVVPIT